MNVYNGSIHDLKCFMRSERSQTQKAMRLGAFGGGWLGECGEEGERKLTAKGCQGIGGGVNVSVLYLIMAVVI